MRLLIQQATKQKKAYNKNREICCPYNPNHVMPFSQLWYHLAFKCEDKQLYGHLYRTCPYNSLHIVAREYYDQHVESCQMKIDVDGTLLKQMSKVATQQFRRENQFQDQ